MHKQPVNDVDIYGIACHARSTFGVRYTAVARSWKYYCPGSSRLYADHIQNAP